MSLSAKLRRAPLRVVTGAFVLNSGLGKLKADEDAAKAMHGLASGTYGFLGNVDAKLFAKGLGAGEIVLGGALLAPFVSPVVAGAGLAAFSGGLLNMYWQTEGMHRPGDPRPTQQGMPIAKDVWMAGIGVGLIVDGLLEPAHDKKIEITAAHQGKKAGKVTRRDRRKAKKARAEARKDALKAAATARAELGRRASKAAKAAAKAQATATSEADALSKRAAKAAKKARASDTAKQARKTSRRAAKRLQKAADHYGPAVADRVSTGAKQARDAAKDAFDDYGPLVADRVSTGAKQARDAATSAFDDYSPVVIERAKQARDAVRDVANDVVDETRQRVSS